MIIHVSTKSADYWASDIPIPTKFELNDFYLYTVNKKPKKM